MRATTFSARRWIRGLVGLLLGSVLLLQPAAAARVRGLGLGDMVERSGRAFVGACTGRSVGVDPATGITYTEYTFRVAVPIKGVDTASTSFRVPGTPERPLIAYLPVFEVGEPALLLLYPESGAGFATPMGLDQGRFRLAQSRDGTRVVINGRNNVGIFRDVPEQLLEQHQLDSSVEGAVSLEQIVPLMRLLAAEDAP